MLYWLIQHESGYYNQIICAEGSDPLKGLTDYVAIRWYDTYAECKEAVEKLNFKIWREPKEILEHHKNV